MDDQHFHALQAARFADIAERLAELAQRPEHAQLESLAAQCRELGKRSAALLDEAPALIYRLFTVAPGVAQGFPRDLLWYLGAECLHFMPDEEIERYTALDESRRQLAAQGGRFDWAGACAGVPKPH